MNVNIAKDVFSCPKCGTGGGAIGFWGFKMHGWDPSSMSPEQRKQVMAEHRQNYSNGDYQLYTRKRAEIKREDVAVTDINDRDYTYTHLLNHLTLIDEHYNNLIRRGLRDSDIQKNGYKSIPTIGAKAIPGELRMQDGANLSGVPGFYKPYGDWELYCPNDPTTGKTATGFYIPVRAIPEDAFKNPMGKIQGFQQRADNPPTPKLRYKWLSTKDKRQGAAAETWCHFVGYPQREIWLTEGPLKGDIAHRFSGDTFICVPGVNAQVHLEEDLKKLWELGVRHINIAFDMDYKHNPNVQKALVKLLDMIKRLGFTYRIREWDEQYKGIDDYYLAMYLKSGGKLDPERN